MPVEQRRAGVAPALHQIERAIGKPRLGPAPRHDLADQRRFLGRLEHHRIAGQQRGDDVAVRQVAGEVVRPQHRHHAMRAVA